MRIPNYAYLILTGTLLLTSALTVAIAEEKPPNYSFYLGHSIDVLNVRTHLRPKDGVIELKGGAAATYEPKTHTTFEETTGQSFSQFAENMAVKAGVKGGLGAFSAELESNFSQSDTSEAENFFSSIQTRIETARYYVPSDSSTLRRHLTKEFKRYINNKEFDADKLLDDYGTHVLTSALMGGKADTFYNSDSSQSMSKGCFELRVKASYGAVSGHASVDTCTSSSSGSSSLTTSLQADGGTGVSRTELRDSQNSDAWTQWTKSLTESNAKYLGATVASNGEMDNTIGIWELIGDGDVAVADSKAAKVYLAYKKRLALNPTIRIFTCTSRYNEPINTDMCPKGAYVDGEPVQDVIIPEGWKLLSGGARLNNIRETGGASWDHLLTASYPTNDTTWRASGKYSSQHSDGTITAYAVAIEDIEHIWEVQQTESQWTPEVRGKDWRGTESALKYEHHREEKGNYVLVGGGAQVRSQWRNGGMLTHSFPSKAETTSMWTAKFTSNASDAQYRSMCQPPGVSWFTCSNPGVKSEDSPTYRAADQWGNVKNGATMKVYAISLRSKLGYELETEIRDAISPYSDNPTDVSGANRCLTLTAGGVQGAYNYGPTMIMASYPSSSARWETVSSFDRNNVGGATIIKTGETTTRSLAFKIKDHCAKE